MVGIPGCGSGDVDSEGRDKELYHVMCGEEGGLWTTQSASTAEENGIDRQALSSLGRKLSERGPRAVRLRPTPDHLIDDFNAHSGQAKMRILVRLCEGV
jgi:hypothetical protein